MSGKTIMNINESFTAFLSAQHSTINDMYQGTDRSKPVFEIFEEWLLTAGDSDTYFQPSVKQTKKKQLIRENVYEVIKEFLCNNVWVISAVSEESKNVNETMRVLKTLWMDKSVQDKITSCTKAKKVTRDPNQPSKNKTAYMFYCMDNKNDAREKNQGLKYTEIVKILSSQWKSIKETEESEQYKTKACKDKERYISEMETYTGKPFQMASEKSGMDKEARKKERDEKRAKKQREKEEKQKNKKKTAWGCYVQEMLTTVEWNEETHGERMKILGAKWKEVDDKSKWKNIASEYNSKIVSVLEEKTDTAQEEVEEKKKTPESDTESSDSDSDSDDDDIENIISDMTEKKKAFDFFCDDRKAKLAKKYPDMTMSVIEEKMKAEWKHITSDGKFKSLFTKYQKMEKDN
jgi:hypothetical protein